MVNLLVIALLVAQSAGPTMAPTKNVRLPNKAGSLKFAVIGDSGQTGGGQDAVAAQLAKWRANFPFEFVLMMGDNLYGTERPHDYEKKFSVPYKPIIDAGVKFYAALGNHDDPSQRLYKPFNMNGERFYTFKAPRGSARFYALDSNYMQKEQLDWLAKELASSDSDWKIAFFHHPLYSSGEKHGSDQSLREQVEPLFIKNGVDVVFTGHEHFYERLKPQNGIHHIILGSSAKLRRGNIGQSGMTAKGFDEGFTFMIVEIIGDELHFQTISDQGKTIDSGVIPRRLDEKR